MGGLFCSYHVKNSITKLRKSILESKPEEIKGQKIENLINKVIDNEGNTPLLLSIEQRQLECFKLLINENNIDLNKANSMTELGPLHLLALSKPIIKEDKFERVSNYAYRFRKQSFTFANSSLLLVSQSSNSNNALSIARKISDSSSTSTTSSTMSPNKSVSSLNNKLKPIDEHVLREMVSLLAKNGADLNYSSDIIRANNFSEPSIKNTLPNVNTSSSEIFNQVKQMTPLFVAVLMSQNEIFIDELIKQGCDCKYQDKKTKINALHMACGISRPDLVSILLDSGKCDIDSKSTNGFTCLHYLALAERDDMSVIQLLMSHLKQNFINSIKKRDQNLEEYLLKFIDTPNNDNQTALMLAAAKNKQNLVKFLLDYKASIELTDYLGFKTIDYAKQNSCSHLLNSYASVNKKLIAQTQRKLMSSQLSVHDMSNVSLGSGEIKIFVTDFSTDKQTDSLTSSISNKNDTRIEMNHLIA